MKKVLLNMFALVISGLLNAQTVTDTVSLGAGYANQKWYSLKNDEQGSSAKNNWDLAFDISGMGTSIHINSITGVTLWTYKKGSVAAWNNVDTSGISNWTPQYNSDTTWTIGALDKGKVASNYYDVGWGVYNPVTHVVAGDSLFIVKLSNGQYKKLLINNIAGGGYNFEYADINGDNNTSYFLDKAKYTGKNFAYFSLINNVEIDREPVVSANWDITFTQYTTFIPTPYIVTGVLANKGVKVAKAIKINDVSNYNSYGSHSFATAINTIGYDWKVFAGTWSIEDSLIYFIKDKNADVWKVIFTGFGGSANGNCIFKKQNLGVFTALETIDQDLVQFNIYPNPSEGKLELLYEVPQQTSLVTLEILNCQGEQVFQSPLLASSGFYHKDLSYLNLSSGMYLISITSGKNKNIQKLIIK